MAPVGTSGLVQGQKWEPLIPEAGRQVNESISTRGYSRFQLLRLRKTPSQCKLPFKTHKRKAMDERAAEEKLQGPKKIKTCEDVAPEPLLAMEKLIFHRIISHFSSHIETNSEPAPAPPVELELLQWKKGLS